jgi:hypothetical protein
MTRTLIAWLLGLSIGAAGAWWLGANRLARPAIDEPLLVRDIVDVPKMRAADAETHRADRYSRIRTIEDTLALPGDFTQTEALYILAGRADSAEVQELIHEANRIADPTDRGAALSILFLRLAELDPRSALTLARMPGFSKNRGLESTIWRTWSKLDLDAALAHAKTLSNPADRNEAAQTILAAYGYLGNASTQRIEDELGVRADGNARARYLYNIADRSPADAVRWIQSLPPMQQLESVRLFAGYLARRDSAEMLAYGNLFQNPQNRKIFEDVIRAAYAQENPEQFLASLPPGAARGHRNGEYMVALRALAERDIDRALEYYDDLRSPNDRSMLGAIIAGQLVIRDPDRAIRWALEQDSSDTSVVIALLSQLAAADPARALHAIDQLDNAQVRRQALVNVVGSAAQADPLAVRAYVDNIADPRDREMATNALFNTWLMVDPATALDHVLGTDVNNADALIAQAGFQLAVTDLDAAIRTLPRLDGPPAEQWRAAIAHQLVQQRGAAAAQRFVEQQRGQPGFDQVQAAVINGLADHDIHAARQMIDSMPAGFERDQTHANMISRHAYSNPQEAATWLASIEDEGLRGMASQQVASAWQQTDPQGAINWVLNLPVGPARDDALLGLSANLVDRGEAVTESLVGQIDDPEKRRQAYIMQVWNVARTDKERALTLLQKLDLSDEERRQFEAQVLRRSDDHYGRLQIAY